MTRTLTITGTEWASVHDGTLWLVREGTWTFPNGMEYADVVQSSIPLPPVEFTLACETCETCGGTQAIHEHVVRDDIHIAVQSCPDCRIELVGPCPYESDHTWLTDCVNCSNEGTVTLGYAYAVGSPLRHPEWVGKWAIEFEVVS